MEKTSIFSKLAEESQPDAIDSPTETKKMMKEKNLPTLLIAVA